MISSYVLVVVYTLSGIAYGQEVLVETNDKEMCEQARKQLLQIPGYVESQVLCIPGRSK